MPASVQGGIDIAVDKEGQVPSLRELTFKEGDRYLKSLINQTAITFS